MDLTEQKYIAVDVGGTQIRAALYPADSITPIVIERTTTVHTEQTPLERLLDLIQRIWPEEGSVAAIGVAAAGPLDPYEGIIYEAPNVPGWVDFPLRSHLENCLKIPVALGNDANLAAFGEWRYGSGQGHHHLIYVTVSTGIGGGVIIDDQMLLGQQGLAAEIGHITVLPGGPLCGCGKRGHLEAVASGPAIAAWYAQEVERGAASSIPAGVQLTAKIIGEAAVQGDSLAQTAIARSGQFLGRALAEFAHIFNPSIIIIGGGVSKTGPLLLDPLWKELQASVMTPAYYKQLTLTTAALGDEAGLIGALALARSLT
jgi:glucokinase